MESEKIRGEAFLFFYLYIMLIIVGAIFVYALFDYVSTNFVETYNLQAEESPAKTPATANAVQAQKTAQSDDNVPFREEISLSDLALDYLGPNGKITIMGRDGIKHFNGSGANSSRCSVYIYINAEETATHCRYALSATIFNPILDNGPDLPFARDNITIETEVILENTFRPMVQDETAGFMMDRDTYAAMMAILKYYTGDASHDDYLEDPLVDTEHTFIYTGPTLAPL